MLSFFFIGLVAATQLSGIGATTHQTHTIHQTNQFSCGAQDGFYPSPNSCLEYFICASRISYAVRCADGLVFNADSGFCDWPEHYRCTVGDSPDVTTSSAPATTQAPQTSTQAPVATTQPPKVPAVTSSLIHMLTSTLSPTQPPKHTPAVDLANFCKTQSDGVHADPTDCQHFIDCANGHTFRQRCAPGTGWRDDISTCDLIANVPGC